MISDNCKTNSIANQSENHLDSWRDNISDCSGSFSGTDMSQYYEHHIPDSCNEVFFSQGDSSNEINSYTTEQLSMFEPHLDDSQFDLQSIQNTSNFIEEIPVVVPSENTVPAKTKKPKNSKPVQKKKPKLDISSCEVEHSPIAESKVSTDKNKKEKSLKNRDGDSVQRLYSPKLVVQQNRLIEAFKDLNIYERRLLLYLSTTVRTEVQTNPNQDTFLVDILDFARTFGLEKGKHLNSFMRQSGKTMQSKTFAYTIAEDGYVDDVDVNFAFRFRYRANTSQMWVSLAPELIVMLTVFDADHPFTQYELCNVVSMKNQNTIILFELLAQYRTLKKRKLTVEYMRKVFKCEDKYPHITDFMRYVVKKTVDEINEITTFKVTYTVEKNGGTPVAVAFKFTDVKRDMQKKGKELALIDFGYTTESEISKHNANKALTLSSSQLRRIATRKQFVADNQVSSNSPANSSMSAYYDFMVDKLIQDGSFVVKHTLDYYLEQAESAT